MSVCDVDFVVKNLLVGFVDIYFGLASLTLQTFGFFAGLSFLGFIFVRMFNLHSLIR
jgi:hypothetical protein